MKTSFLIALLILSFPLISYAVPPFGGTLSTSFDFINETDPTTFVDSVYIGMGERTIPDGRVGGYITVNVYRFTVTYSDSNGSSVEFQVNSEFNSIEASRTEVNFYAPVIGRQPFALRTNLRTVWINKGDESFGVDTWGIFVHTDRAEWFIGMGLLEEALAHQLIHLSLDMLYENTPGWLQAQIADGEYISYYARDNPNEDFVESFMAFMALYYRPDRISEETADDTANAIPNRIAYLRNTYMNMAPFGEFGFLINFGLSGAWYNPLTSGQGIYVEVLPVIKKVAIGWYTFDLELPPANSSATLGEAGHRWFTTLGPYEGDTATMTLYVTKGGVFDKANPPAITDEAGDGVVTIEFADCTEAIMTYEITSSGISGVIPLKRINNNNEDLCKGLSVDKSLN